MDNQPQQPQPIQPDNNGYNPVEPSQPIPQNPPVAPPQPTVYGPPQQQPVPQPQSDGIVVGGSPEVLTTPDPNRPVVNNQGKKSKTWLILAIIIVVLLAGGGGAYYFLKHNSNSGGSSGSVADCGKVVVTNQTLNKSPYTGCFDQHFTSCTPAQITIDNQSSLGKGMINQYDIKAKQGTSCLVQWEYVSLPYNTSWDGKTITCPYNNSKDFMAALSANSNFTGCSGPLLTTMNSPQSGSGSSSSIPGGTTTQLNGGGSVTTAPGVTVLSN